MNLCCTFQLSVSPVHKLLSYDLKEAALWKKLKARSFRARFHVLIESNQVAVWILDIDLPATTGSIFRGPDNRDATVVQLRSQCINIVHVTIDRQRRG